MRYLIDTDVLSKVGHAHGSNIRKWLASVDDSSLAISVLTIFEISRGIQKKRDDGEGSLADALQIGLETIKAGYSGRILPLHAKLAESWGAIAGPDRRHWFDRGLIATARLSGLAIVTCNTRDMIGRGVEVVGPERDPAGHWAPDGMPIKQG